MTASISRRAARECAVKALYSYEFNKGEDPKAYFDLVCTEGELPVNEFASSIFFGVIDNLADIDSKITEFAKGWRIERIAKMSLSVLRVCVYEMLYTDVPKPVAINEAMEIDKAYDTDGAPAFINGILNAVAKSLDGENK